MTNIVEMPVLCVKLSSIQLQQRQSSRMQERREEDAKEG